MHSEANQRELRAAFEAAMEFGLSEEDVWATARAVAAKSDPDASLEEWFEELVAALASRITEMV